jgi:hypothetical protein
MIVYQSIILLNTLYSILSATFLLLEFIMAAAAVISQNFCYYITNDAAAAVTFTLTRGVKVVAMRVFATNAGDTVVLKDANGGNTIASATTVASGWADATITPANASMAAGSVPEITPAAATTTQIIIECILESGITVALS